MPRPISNVRIASSFVTHTAGAARTIQEVDFDLGPNEAIEIFAISGIMTQPGLTTSNTTTAEGAVQSVHVEDDNARAVELLISDTDAFQLDDEAIYKQGLFLVQKGDNVNHDTGFGLSVQPTTPIVYPVPIIAATNLSHVIRTADADLDIAGTVDIHYRYVMLSQNELAFAIARRR